jgi:hypothetical protein
MLMVLFSVMLVCVVPAAGQIVEEFYCIESPTAGILAHGGYLFRGSLGPESRLLFEVDVGFHDRLMAGISFGMQNLIGRGEVTVNDIPGFKIRFRILEENVSRPALALGVDTQGEGIYLEHGEFEDRERYERKSKGFYGVLSKNYHLLSDFSIHGGINYSFETEDERGVNLFAALSIELVQGFAVLLDYNAALDDDDPDSGTSLTRGRGYLDAGVRFDYRDNLRFKFFFKDLLGNYIPDNSAARYFEIFYISFF